MKTNGPSFPFLLITTFLCLGVTPLAAGELTAQKADISEELRKFEIDWAAAVETNDAKRIEAFFTLDFLFVGPKGLLQDRAQHLEDFRSGKLHIDSVKTESETIHVYIGAAVISSRVMVKGKIKINGAEVDISGPYQFTDTLIQQDRKWLAAARQQTQIFAGPKKVR